MSSAGSQILHIRRQQKGLLAIKRHIGRHRYIRWSTLRHPPYHDNTRHQSDRLLENFERLLGAEHPDTLASVNNLAECLRALGDASEALPLVRRALENRERVLGVEHRDTLTSVNNLAACTQALGNSAGALPLYRRPLENFERLLGAEHPQTLISVNNLASCLRALGDAAGPCRSAAGRWRTASAGSARTIH
jgi:tetratricopeptide (TPR) repeat protein